MQLDAEESTPASDMISLQNLVTFLNFDLVNFCLARILVKLQTESGV